MFYVDVRLPESHDVQYHKSQHQSHIQPIDAPLHVVVAIFNPTRSASRYRLFKAFRKYVADSGAILTTVELALGHRHFEVTSRDNPDDVQVRSKSIMFHKENLLNIGIRHITRTTYPDAKYIAWMDGDISFTRPDWAAETVHLLQTFSVVQMWSNAINLGEDGIPIQHFSSFAYDWTNSQHTLQPFGKDGKPITKVETLSKVSNEYWHRHHPPHHEHPPKPHEPAPQNTLETGRFHSGLAWSARRDVLDKLGGLGDIAILGSGDHHMAWAFAGDVERSIHRMTSPDYKLWWERWQERANKFVCGNIGYMPGTIIANYHGLMRDRRYLDRWRVLNVAQFSPYEDLIVNSQGVYEWAGNKPKLEADVRHYFELRHEP